MELLLNLAWLLLVVPAYWLWRDSRCTLLRPRFSSLQCMLALGCMLVVLFPIVSATDDLCAMRAEMEESPCGKRSFCEKGGDKPSASKWQVQPSLAVNSGFLLATDVSWYSPRPARTSIPVLRETNHPGRAPPVVG